MKKSSSQSFLRLQNSSANRTIITIATYYIIQKEACLERMRRSCMCKKAMAQQIRLCDYDPLVFFFEV